MGGHSVFRVRLRSGSSASHGMLINASEGVHTGASLPSGPSSFWLPTSPRMCICSNHTLCHAVARCGGSKNNAVGPLDLELSTPLKQSRTSLLSSQGTRPLSFPNSYRK